MLQTVQWTADLETGDCLENIFDPQTWQGRLKKIRPKKERKRERPVQMPRRVSKSSIESAMRDDVMVMDNVVFELNEVKVRVHAGGQRIWIGKPLQITVEGPADYLDDLEASAEAAGREIDCDDEACTFRTRGTVLRPGGGVDRGVEIVKKAGAVAKRYYAEKEKKAKREKDEAEEKKAKEALQEEEKGRNEEKRRREEKREEEWRRRMDKARQMEDPTYVKPVFENAKEVASDTFQKVTNSLTKGAGDILSNTASLAGNAASVAVPLYSAYKVAQNLKLDLNFMDTLFNTGNKQVLKKLNAEQTRIKVDSDHVDERSERHRQEHEHTLSKLKEGRQTTIALAQQLTQQLEQHENH